MALSIRTARALMQSHVAYVTEPATRRSRRNTPGISFSIALLLVAAAALAFGIR